MKAHKRFLDSDAPGASTGAAPTPPMSQAWQASKRCREAEDTCSWDTEEPSAKRRAGFPDTSADREGLSASEALNEVNQSLHSVEDLPLIHDMSEVYDDAELEQLFAAFDGSQTHAHPQMSIDDLLDETLFLDDVDVAFTLDESRNGTPLDAEGQPPPSSVLRGLDCASRSAEEFDRTLQYSSPQSSSTLAAGREREMPLLTQEEDWEGVRQNAQRLTNGLTSTEPGYARQEQPTSAKRVDYTIMPTPASTFKNAWEQTQHGGNMIFKAFKTFFHMNEMLEAKVQIFKNQPEIVFDLFARVLYSSRENFGKKQYFQFRDLFKETPPYLSGALLS